MKKYLYILPFLVACQTQHTLPPEIDEPMFILIEPKYPADDNPCVQWQVMRNEGTIDVGGSVEVGGLGWEPYAERRLGATSWKRCIKLRDQLGGNPNLSPEQEKEGH